MNRAPSIILNGAFGASIQQLCLDVTFSDCKIVFNWLKYLTMRVEGDKVWSLKLKSPRELVKMIEEFIIENTLVESPNDAFNYLILFLDHLPSSLIPELYFNNEEFPTLNILAAPEIDIVLALKELLINVRQSQLCNEDKEMFENSIWKSLTKKWTQPTTITVDYFVNRVSVKILPKVSSVDQNILVQYQNRTTAAELTIVQAIEHALLQAKEHAMSRTSGYIYMEACKEKLDIVTIAKRSTRRIVNEYHYQQFCNYLQQLKGLIDAKDDAEKRRLFESCYLFIEVEKLLIAMHYHLDIFAHFLLKESYYGSPNRWSEIGISFGGFGNLAHHFWLEVFGPGRLMVQREIFEQQFKKHCLGAQVFDSHDMDRFLVLLDKFRTGFVTVFAFAYLMNSFGNNMVLVKQALNCPGFHGYMGREGARLLDGQPEGSYLIRFDKELIVNYVGGERMPDEECDYTDVRRCEIIPKLVSFDQSPAASTVQLQCVVMCLNQGPVPTIFDRREFSSLQQLIAEHKIWTAPFQSFSTDIGFMGDLQVNEVPLLSYDENLVRFSSQRGFMTLTFGSLTRDNIHTRVQVIGQKIRTTGGDYKDLQEFISKFRASSTKPFLFFQNSRVYQTEDEVLRAAKIEVWDPFSLNTVLSLDKGRKYSISRLKTLSDRYFNCGADAVPQLAQSLLENSSLTNVELSSEVEFVPLLNALKSHPNIKELTIRGHSAPESVIIELITSLPQLQHLSIDASEDIFKAIESIATLKKLTISSAPRNDWDFEAMKALCKSHRGLEAMNIKFPGSAFTAEALAEMPNLKELVCYDFMAPYRGLRGLRSALAIDCDRTLFYTIVKSLKVLRVNFGCSHTSEPDYLPATDLKFHSTRYHHPQCESWKSAKSTWLYWSCDNSQKCCEQVSESDVAIDVQNLQRIEHLRLRKVHKNAAFMHEMTFWLPKLSNLKSLVFDACSFTRNYTSTLANSLSESKSIRALKFQRVKIKGIEQLRDSTQYLVSILRSMPQLFCCQVSDGNFVVPKDTIMTNLLYSCFSLRTDALSLPDWRKDPKYSQYAAASYQRRQPMIDEIQNWIGSVISIVQCSELFYLLPIEIWELIFSEFSFLPYLDALTAFKTIARNRQKKVIKVVDWDFWTAMNEDVR